MLHVDEPRKVGVVHSHLEQFCDPHGNVVEILARVHDHAVHRAVVRLVAAAAKEGRRRGVRDPLSSYQVQWSEYFGTCMPLPSTSRP